ncbi:CPS_collapsed_G0017020.mRNA.1.CDS.1 [Saccharomyces cerevisiae]|nr:CPS_collapsed_G0017020.mRNA.1.CDS.1 [Saccharomyces cerevisiae]
MGSLIKVSWFTDLTQADPYLGLPASNHCRCVHLILQGLGVRLVLNNSGSPSEASFHYSTDHFYTGHNELIVRCGPLLLALMVPSPSYRQ